MLAVLDPEIIDILPVVAQDLPLSGVGRLEQPAGCFDTCLACWPPQRKATTTQKIIE